MDRLYRTMDARLVRRWQRQARAVESQSERLKSLTDVDLLKHSLSLRYQALSGRPLDQLAVDAFSLVREAARRTIGMRHYPVQLLGGFAMHHGSIVVMQTGEGKTLTATLPLYLASLAGHGAHLVTANDYLARRDADLMKPVYEALGLRVGIVISDTPRSDRIQQYQSDVVYSTAKEIGFDFLRDRLATRRNRLESTGPGGGLFGSSGTDPLSLAVQRELHFVLVDEADSILIDEARTPLIISSPPGEIALAKARLYAWCAEVAEQFELDLDYTVDPKTRQVELTFRGRQLARTLTKPEELAATPQLDIYGQLEQAIFVLQNYTRDRQYVIRDNEVVIVDEFTGRLAEGRKWRAGLHQAIEAREGLNVSVETGESARMTMQDLFLRYHRLAGMTGTVANSANELRHIYQVRVIEIPTNRPPCRECWPEQVLATESQKWDAIAQEIRTVHQTGRPVLIGTRSIDQSEKLSGKLQQLGIDHDVLNARNLAREAEIVAAAGNAGKVTVATNMAGRGTDIKISQAAHRLGGLHVICSERHDSARIDRQLIGRCGRQGDPGSFRQFSSLEDDILERGLSPGMIDALRKRWSHSPAHLQRCAPKFSRAQQRIERRHYLGRKMLLLQEKQRHELQREMGQDPYLDSAGA